MKCTKPCRDTQRRDASAGQRGRNGGGCGGAGPRGAGGAVGATEVYSKVLALRKEPKCLVFEPGAWQAEERFLRVQLSAERGARRWGFLGALGGSDRSGRWVQR